MVFVTCCKGKQNHFPSASHCARYKVTEDIRAWSLLVGASTTNQQILRSTVAARSASAATYGIAAMAL